MSTINLHFENIFEQLDKTWFSLVALCCQIISCIDSLFEFQIFSGNKICTHLLTYN